MLQNRQLKFFLCSNSKTMVKPLAEPPFLRSSGTKWILSKNKPTDSRWLWICNGSRLVFLLLRHHHQGTNEAWVPSTIVCWRNNSKHWYPKNGSKRPKNFIQWNFLKNHVLIRDCWSKSDSNCWRPRTATTNDTRAMEAKDPRATEYL